MPDHLDAPRRGARLNDTIRRAVSLASRLLLAAAAAGCAGDAPLRARAAADSATADSTTAQARAGTPNVPPPEPAAPETTWVRLAYLGSDSGPRARRRTFRTSTDRFRVIIELREPTTVFNQGRVQANILSPLTSLPIQTLESVIPPQLEARADTSFVETPPGEYTLYLLFDYGVREWGITVEAPRVREATP